jgi:hypothetical protein
MSSETDCVYVLEKAAEPRTRRGPASPRTAITFGVTVEPRIQRRIQRMQVRRRDQRRDADGMSLDCQFLVELSYSRGSYIAVGLFKRDSPDHVALS